MAWWWWNLDQSPKGRRTKFLVLAGLTITLMAVFGIALRMSYSRASWHR
jgi:hypothetical protein